MASGQPLKYGIMGHLASPLLGVELMACFAILSLALLLPTAAPADDTDAKKLAQDILTKGAALFDKREAAAMAATYMEDADGIVVIKDNDTGTIRHRSPGAICDRAGLSEHLQGPEARDDVAELRGVRPLRRD